MDISVFNKRQLSEDCLSSIGEFVYALNNNYEKRNQFNQQIIIKQQAIGKVAEWIAYESLKPFLPDLTKPDMRILTAKQKNWDSDLHCGDLSIACKGCEFGNSWVFQFCDEDGRGCDLKIFGLPDERTDIFAGVSVDNLREGVGHIKALTTLAYLHERDCFQDPRKKDLIGLKKVVYYGHLTCCGYKNNVVEPSVLELINARLNLRPV